MTKKTVNVAIDGKLKNYQGFLFGFDVWNSNTEIWSVHSETMVAELEFATNKTSPCGQCVVNPSDLVSGVKVTMQLYNDQMTVCKL